MPGKLARRPRHPYDEEYAGLTLAELWLVMCHQKVEGDMVVLSSSATAAEHAAIARRMGGWKPCRRCREMFAGFYDVCLACLCRAKTVECCADPPHDAWQDAEDPDVDAAAAFVAGGASAAAGGTGAASTRLSIRIGLGLCRGGCCGGRSAGENMHPE